MSPLRLVDPRGRVRATLLVERATTPAQVVRGLAGRPQVRPGTGMCFVFGADTRRDFTVADMLVPIDLAWLDRDGRVLGTATDLRPGDARPIVAPAPYRAVLETASGALRSLGFGRGWRVG